MRLRMQRPSLQWAEVFYLLTPLLAPRRADKALKNPFAAVILPKGELWMPLHRPDISLSRRVYPFYQSIGSTCHGAQLSG